MTTLNPLSSATLVLRERVAALPPGLVRAAWLAVVVLAGVVSWAAFSSWAAGDALRERAEAVAALLNADPKSDAAAPDAGEAESGSRGRRGRASQVAAVRRVAERRFFSPAPPQGFRYPRGVLGDRVLYSGGQSFAVGDNAMGATVKEIGLNHVELEYEGETVKVNFSPGGGSNARPSRRGGRRFRRSR